MRLHDDCVVVVRVPTDMVTRDPVPVNGASGMTLVPIHMHITGVEVERFAGQLHAREHYVRVDFIVPHRDHGEPFRLCYRKRIPTIHIEAMAMATLVRMAILEAMAHEVDEMLYLGGDRLNEPHPGER